MNNSKLTLAKVISILSGLVLMFFVFLGEIFYTEGDLLKSRIPSILYATLLVTLVFLLARVKAERKRFRSRAVIEFFLFVLFIITAIEAFDPLSHFFSVNEKKATIEKNITEDVNKVSKMFDRYESLANRDVFAYGQELDGIIRRRNTMREEYLSKGFTQFMTQNQISDHKERILEAYKDDLMPAMYLPNKKSALAWLDVTKESIAWNPLTMFNNIKLLEQNAKEWCATLEGYKKVSMARFKGMQFECELSFTSKKGVFTKKSTASFISYAVALLLFVLILLPYLFASRDPRHPGFRQAILEMGAGDKGPGKTL